MMKLMKSMMISCDKATFLISKKEEGKLSSGERIHLVMHLSMCKFCKLFEKQSVYITRQVRNFSPPAQLSAEDKARFVKALEK